MYHKCYIRPMHFLFSIAYCYKNEDLFDVEDYTSEFFSIDWQLNYGKSQYNCTIEQILICFLIKKAKVFIYLNNPHQNDQSGVTKDYKIQVLCCHVTGAAPWWSN